MNPANIIARSALRWFASLALAVGISAAALYAQTESPPSAATLSELEAGIDQIDSQLAEARKQITALSERDALRAKRLPLIPEELASARAQLAAIPAPSPLTADATAEKQNAHQAIVQQRRELAEKITQLETEAEGFAQDDETLIARKREAADKITRLEQQRTNWQATANEQRMADSDEASVAAEERVDALKSNPLLSKLAKEVAELTGLRSAPDSPSAKYTSAQNYRASMSAQRARLEEESGSARRRIELLDGAGLSIDRETGRLLRAQRVQLPEPADLRTDLAEKLQTTAKAKLAKFDLEERAARMPADINQHAAALIEEADKPKPTLQQVRELLEERQTAITALLGDYQTYVDDLDAGNIDAKGAIEASRKFSLMLDQRLLWTPSAEPVSLTSFGEEAEATAFVLTSSATQRWFRHLAKDIRTAPVTWILTILVIAVLILGRRYFIARIRESGDEAMKRNCSTVVPTITSLIFSTLLVAPLPLAFAFLAIRSDLSPAYAVAFRNVAIFLGLGMISRAFARPKGLLDAHVGYEKDRTQLIRRNLTWFVPIMAVVMFFSTLLAKSHISESAGRLLFILSMILQVILLHRIFHPKRHLIIRKGRPSRIAHLIYVIAILVPFGLAVAAALGFFASALSLREQAVNSAWLLLTVLFFMGLALRWILVSRRRLAIHQALERRAAAANENQGMPQDLPSLAEVKAQAVNVVDVEEQTIRLLRVVAIVVAVFGLWGIWAKTLPAMSILDRVPLWPAPGAEVAATPAVPLVSQPITGGDSATDSALPELIQPASGKVSLQDLLVALVMLIVTWIAAKNVPGVLELTLLRRLRLAPGSSFAFTTTVRYLIVLVGLMIAFGKIGITWSNVQWIAAAITLGIGFGLQEVFANFVAGIILLFERPMRLGDVVTVGDISGKVSQIRMRATTIQQFNGRELIVPNKTFITGELVNWTLSDTVLRIEVPVGIAYGSDTEKARDILLGIANDHPKILDDPEPGVVFGAFGDSALDFELRVHVGSADHLQGTKNDLHYRIEKQFREAGIEIAFPQTDIHIRTMPDKKGDQAGSSS